MKVKEFWVKPNQPNVPVPWPGAPGSDVPGPNNFGTPDRPVLFSAGAVSEWIYDPSISKDDSDTEVYKYVINFTVPADGSQPIYYVGPQNPNGGGSTCIYIQANPARGNRKVGVHLLGPKDREPTLFYTGRNYTQQQVSAWKAGVEDAVIRSAPGEVEEVVIRNLVIDANFMGHGYPSQQGSKTRGYKIMGIQVRARQIYIDNAEVRNCGSNSDMIGGSLANECFPINTYSYNTQPSDQPPCLIENCLVNGFYAINGGYATMISVNPFTSAPEVLPVTFYDASGSNRAKKFCAVVRNCRVRGIPGVNGLGCSGTTATDGALASNYVLFKDNIVEDCTIGANQDTSGVRYVHYEGNSFINCSVGIQLGTPTGSMRDGKPDPLNPTFHRNFYIDGNTHQCLRQNTQLDAKHPDRVKGAMLLLRQSSAGIVFTNNVMSFVEPYRFCAWEAEKSDYYLRLVCPSAVDPYYLEYYGTAGPGASCHDDWNDPARTFGSMVITRPERVLPFSAIPVNVR